MTKVLHIIGMDYIIEEITILNSLSEDIVLNGLSIFNVFKTSIPVKFVLTNNGIT